MKIFSAKVCSARSATAGTGVAHAQVGRNTAAPGILPDYVRGQNYKSLKQSSYNNPVTFTRYLKHTMEHGHANNRGEHFYSCCY